MVNLKMVELYSILLIMCTSLIIFGMYQMQAMLATVVSKEEMFTAQLVLQGVQISAVGLILSALIMFLFFRQLKKKYLAKGISITA